VIESTVEGEIVGEIERKRHRYRVKKNKKLDREIE